MRGHLIYKNPSFRDEPARVEVHGKIEESAEAQWGLRYQVVTGCARSVFAGYRIRFWRP